MPFFESQNNCPDFGDCVHLWVKFSIQNAVLRLSRREKSKILPCEASFSCVSHNVAFAFLHKVRMSN